uniref:Uncharacterized protein n=1 Tax=Anguilla anguilla TaxID=7936 RepID=A0A0E9Q0P9_ANGAN
MPQRGSISTLTRNGWQVFRGLLLLASEENSKYSAYLLNTCLWCARYLLHSMLCQ